MSVATGMFLRMGLLVTAGWLLAGCSTISSMNPVNWWHRQEGGKIAEDRPPPPGADQPYPNMATVPAKPTPPNQEELKKLTDSLVADRTNAQHAAQSAPLADPSSPTASPSLFGVGTAPPPPPSGVAAAGSSPPGTGAKGGGGSGTPVASASLPAVTAPATPPSPAPRKAVQSTPLGAPPSAAGQAGPAPATPASSTAAAPSVALGGPLPALPSGPPPRPAAAGAPPAETVRPTPMPAAPARPSATIVFLERASNLTPPAADEVKAFAAKRGTATISIIGYGDSTSNEPDAQSAALNLGLSRAIAILDALKADGVPGTSIRVSAEASGRGAALQLLQ